MPSQIDDQIRALVDSGAPSITLEEVDALRSHAAPHRRSKRAFVSVGIAAAVVIAIVASVLAVRVNDNDKGSVRPADQPPTTLTEPETTPVQGEPAVWVLPDASAVTPDSREFTADVTRLACSSGVTGSVLQPTIREEAERVVITFTVEPLPSGGGSTCIGGPPVPTIVRLKNPIGQRQLVDGACEPGGAAVTTAYCNVGFADPVRWRPATP